MSTYELHSGDEPVVVEVRAGIVTVSVGDLTASYEVHRDADALDDRHDLLAALRAAQAPLVEAVDRVKLIHARDQAMTVLYAMRHHVKMSEAVALIKPDYTPAELHNWDEWTPETKQAREEAAKLLADCLRGHRWSVRGDRIGPPPQKRCRALDLDTGELMTTRQLVHADRVTWEWSDVNAMSVPEDRPGNWWQITGAVRELPFDPWAWELEHVAGR